MAAVVGVPAGAVVAGAVVVDEELGQALVVGQGAGDDQGAVIEVELEGHCGARGRRRLAPMRRGCAPVGLVWLSGFADIVARWHRACRGGCGRVSG